MHPNAIEQPLGYACLPSGYASLRARHDCVYGLALRMVITYRFLTTVVKFRQIEYSESEGILCKTEENESFLKANFRNALNQESFAIFKQEFCLINKTKFQGSGTTCFQLKYNVSFILFAFIPRQFFRVVDHQSTFILGDLRCLLWSVSVIRTMA